MLSSLTVPQISDEYVNMGWVVISKILIFFVLNDEKVTRCFTPIQTLQLYLGDLNEERERYLLPE